MQQARTQGLRRINRVYGTTWMKMAIPAGSTPAQAVAKFPGSTTTGGVSSLAGPTGAGTTAAQPVGGSSSGTTYYSPSSESSEAGGMLLNYLLGN